jgi:hypothetical protein
MKIKYYCKEIKTSFLKQEIFSIQVLRKIKIEAFLANPDYSLNREY